MDPLTIAAITSGAISLGKGIMGAVQSAKSNKTIKRLNATLPKYKRPDEYGAELALRAKMAGQGQLPGLGQITDNISGATSQAYGAAEKGAISSNTYMGAVGDIYSKQINAFQDLGIKSAEFQQTQKENYMNTLQKGADYSDQEFQENVMRPWEVNMNEAQSKKQSGGQNLWNGLEGMGSAFINFAGTRYAGEVMSGMQNKGMTSGGGGKSPSMPTPSYDPQQNLLNTLFGMKPKTNWGQ